MYKIAAFIMLLLFMCACKKQRIVYPERKAIVQAVYASGKIMADSEYTVYTLNAGTVVSKLVQEGDAVKKGQIIYVLRHTAPSAKMEAANSAFINARENLSPNSRVLNELRIAMQNADLQFSNDSLLYARLKNLWDQNIGTKVNLDNARTQYELAYNQKRSTLEKYRSTINDLRVAFKNAQSLAAGSRFDLDNYFIRAESSGTIYQLLKEQGEAVKINEPVALVGHSGERIIRLAVDQQDIAQIKAGQLVLLKTDVNGERIFKARISRTYPVMNEADQTFRVDAKFTGDADQPYIQSSVEANIIVARKLNCLTLPLAMLLNGDSVYVLQQGKVVTRAVRTGLRTNNDVELLDGADEHSAIVNPLKK